MRTVFESSTSYLLSKGMCGKPKPISEMGASLLDGMDEEAAPVATTATTRNANSLSIDSTSVSNTSTTKSNTDEERPSRSSTGLSRNNA